MARLSQTFDSFIHPLMRKYVFNSYLKKSKRVEQKLPALFAPISPALVKKHRELWGRLGVPCGDRWLRLHVNLTGIEDYTFCPEDVFFGSVERILNDCNLSGSGPEDKNELNRYVPEGVEPDVLIRYVRGNFFDGKNDWISPERVDEILSSNTDGVIGKPCRRNGGVGVALYKNMSRQWIVENGGESYVLQKRIEQDKFSASFNSSSINTVRMMTLRCPWNGAIVVCRSMMRMGVSDAVVDNMMKGGLCVCIDNHGKFGRYAYDYDGNRYELHPVSHIGFGELTHPYYRQMVEVASSIARKITAYNLLSFDLVPRADGRICVVEINATSQGITQLQYDFGGLFGDNTEQLVDWCAAHRDLCRFKHFRTWY